MADLTTPTDRATDQLTVFPRQPTEHVLCRLHLYFDNTIVMQPDFNSDQVAYIVESGGLGNEVYQYYLEHASTSISKPDLIKERNLFHQVAARQQAYLKQIVGDEFQTVGRS